jgi:hypothetical protein
MWFARLVCSDDDCPDELEVYADSLEELEMLSCDCGCTMEIVGWADSVEHEPVRVVMPLAAAG